MMKKVLVWGTGVNALDFVKGHRSLEIIAYIDNRKKDKEWGGIPILLPQEAENILKRFFVVVAVSEYIYWEIKNQLNTLGLAEFSDYCFHGVYGKKVAIIYGNCHTGPIKEGLSISREFTKEYGFYPLREIQKIKQLEGKELKEESIFRHCDLFLHQSIRKENSYGEEYASENIIKRLKPGCRVVSFPNLYGLPRCFFPQIVMGEAAILRNGIGFYSFRDKFIERLYQEGFGKRYIADMILKSQFTEEKLLKDGFNLFINKVKEREVDWDIKISEWILTNYKKHRMFYDVNHPSNEIVKYIVEQILETLNITDKNLVLDYLLKLDYHEVPVYGYVMRTFGMEWSNDYILRKYSKSTLTNRQIDLYEYVEQYIKWNCD